MKQLKSQFSVFLLGFSLIFYSEVQAQTTIGLGEIAFTGMNTDTPDNFCFILLKDITNTTSINITDHGWLAAGGFAANAGDATISWTAGEDMVCGTQICIQGTTTSNDGGYSNSGSVGGSALSLSGLGDQLFIYQGSAPTGGDQSNFITGIQGNGGGWDADALSGTTSSRPSVFTDNVDVMVFAAAEQDDQSLNPALCGGLTADITVLYLEANWVRSGTVLALPSCSGISGGSCGGGPEIDIEGNSNSIPDGDVTPSLSDDTDFGTVSIGASPSITFTIQNEGTGDLTLSGGPTFVTITGSGLFSVTTQPSGTISAAGSTTFVIEFDGSCPATATTYTATVSVSSDDADESPYTFDIEADVTGVDTDSDGVFDLCDTDDDNDGILDGADPDDTDFNVCGDSDGDGCDDCSVTNDGFGALSDSDPLNDGTDTDCDGICDATDVTDGASQTRGNMLSFDGVSDYVSIGNVAELDFGKASTFTVEAWINTAAASTAMQIISKYEGDLFSSAGWGFQVSGSSLAFYMSGGGLLDLMVSIPTGTPAIKDGLWHHVAVVYDGSNNVTGCTFYIDGVAYAGIDGGGFVATVAGTVTNTENATIGAYDGTTSGVAEYWDGELDEVRVWNDVRTQTEIRENMHLSLSGACDASLDGYWKFNETSGTTAADLSGNGNNGSHMGAPTIAASEASVGYGVSTTHSATATATNYFSPSNYAGHSLDISFATTPPGGEIVVTYIEDKPVGGVPSGALNNFRWDHWVVNNYGPTNSGLDGTMHYSYVDGGITTVSLATYRMHKRGSRSTGAWTQNNAFANAASTIPGNNYIEFDGITSFSMFLPSASISPLPVELLNFVAEKQDQQVLLNWETATEIDNLGFYVQHSTDGIEWEELGFVEGNGTSNVLTNYGYQHSNPVVGLNYYRLDQVDENYEITHSQVEVVHFEELLDDHVTIIPNPNKGQFDLMIYDWPFVDETIIEVFDLRGKLMHSEKIEIHKNAKRFMNLNSLSKGVYLLKIAHDTKIITKKLVVD
jgi:hypothetical protein